MGRMIAMLTMLSLVWVGGSVEASTWYVKSDGSGDTPTIQAAIDSAAVDDTVLVFSGTYTENIDFRGRDIMLASLEGPNTTVIRSKVGGTPVLSVGPGQTTKLTIKGFSITGASGPGWMPDGVRCINGSATFQDCIVYGNSDEGITCSADSVIVLRSIVYNNGFGSGADYGTGLYAASSGMLIVDSCTIYHNKEANIIAEDLGIAQVSHSIICNSPKYGFEIRDGYLLTCGCNDLWANATNYWGVSDQTGLNGNMSLDPMFCDAAATNFTLHGSSPCLDAPGCGRMGALGEGCPVSVGEPMPSSNGLTLSQNAPNPFNPWTRITFSVSVPGEVSLLIHQIAGGLVRKLVDVWREPGVYSEVWDGKADDGRALPSGVYLYRLKAGDFVAARKMVLLR